MSDAYVEVKSDKVEMVLARLRSVEKGKGANFKRKVRRARRELKQYVPEGIKAGEPMPILIPAGVYIAAQTYMNP
jgi:hypothetical protein